MQKNRVSYETSKKEASIMYMILAEVGRRKSFSESVQQRHIGFGGWIPYAGLSRVKKNLPRYAVANNCYD